jgi:hypothetical protein
MNSAQASVPSGRFSRTPGRKLQKDLDIAEYTDSHHDPMIPHTLVLEPGLRVYKIYNGYWFFGRSAVEKLRLDLRAVLQRCRPDSDISSAEQRTAWAKGKKANFFPYGKTQAQLLAEQD